MNNFNELSEQDLEIITENILKRATFPKNKVKVYLAGPWFNKKQEILLDTVSKILKSSQNVSKVYEPKNTKFDKPRCAYNWDIKSIKSCDVVVALIDNKDQGTAFEIGYAQALLKPVITVGLSKDSFLTKTNLMLAMNTSKVTVPMLQNYFDSYFNNVYELKINQKWEDIE